MKRNFWERLGSWEKIRQLVQDKSTLGMRRVAISMALCLIVPNLRAAQNGSSKPPNPENQKCAALAQLNLEGAPEGQL